MSDEAAPRSPRRWIVLGVLALAAVGITIALVMFFGGDTPDAVDAQRALQQDPDEPAVEETPEAPEVPEEEPGQEPEEGAGSEEPVPPPSEEEPEQISETPQEDVDEAPGPPRTFEDLDGLWVVDDTREFDREEGRGTFAGYRIEEELSGVGATTAVGRTPEVDGEIAFDGATVESVLVTVDLTALVSDDGRRDGRVRTQLGPEATATFDLDSAIELPEVPPVGEVIELMVSGTLTLLEVSNNVDVTLQAAVTETGLLVTGSTEVLLSDYEVEVPSAAIVLSASDQATIEWQLFLVRL